MRWLGYYEIMWVHMLLKHFFTGGGKGACGAA